jgi:hypothetical protein
MKHFPRIPPCHSIKSPFRDYPNWSKEMGQYCYMTYEHALQTSRGCAGCRYPKDDRITNLEINEGPDDTKL